MICDRLRDASGLSVFAFIIGPRLLTNTLVRPDRNPVGAGLPAMRACQSTFIEPDTPLSRASPLPQVIRPRS
ncbi:hypothetical protein EI534_17995 [Pseudomonas frederiksbergensis]|nr:hypothetical protein [Pseudomonas frederiksbergensis]